MAGDFDGDGGMDLFVTFEHDHQLRGRILWGNHTDTVHQLLCWDGLQADYQLEMLLVNEPLVFDYNYDYISDLLVVTEEGARVVYVFSDDRSQGYRQVELEPDKTRDKLKRAHANAHVDLNEDGLPDLLLTTQSGLEMYERRSKEGNNSFIYHKQVPWPSEVTRGSCSVDLCVGQAVLTDFDLSGGLDIILPVCYDRSCKVSKIYLVPLQSLWKAKTWDWTPLPLEFEDYHFYPPANPDDGHLLRLLAPRVGDINLDGFPDLLITMQKDGGEPQTQLLLNTECASTADCHDFRKFQLRPEFTKGKQDLIE